MISIILNRSFGFASAGYILPIETQPVPNPIRSRYRRDLCKHPWELISPCAEGVEVKTVDMAASLLRVCISIVSRRDRSPRGVVK
jgi:hypothetical protein